MVIVALAILGLVMGIATLMVVAFGLAMAPELLTADGTAVRLPLSRFRALPIPLESRVTRLPDEVLACDRFYWRHALRPEPQTPSKAAG